MQPNTNGELRPSGRPKLCTYVGIHDDISTPGGCWAFRGRWAFRGGGGVPNVDAPGTNPKSQRVWSVRYRYARYRYCYRTELTEVSGIGIDVVPNLPKRPVPVISAVYTRGMPRYVTYRTHPS